MEPYLQATMGIMIGFTITVVIVAVVYLLFIQDKPKK